MKDKKRKIKYIPFGRLISDLLTQNGLIQDLRNIGLTEDLTESIGDVMDGKNPDRMGVIDKLEVAPFSEDPKEILKKHFMCDGFPMFYDHEPKEVIAEYIYWLGEQGENIEGFTVADAPRAASGEISSPPRAKVQKKKKAAAAAEEEPPKKKKKSEPKQKPIHNKVILTSLCPNILMLTHQILRLVTTHPHHLQKHFLNTLNLPLLMIILVHQPPLRNPSLNQSHLIILMFNPPFQTLKLTLHLPLCYMSQ